MTSPPNPDIESIPDDFIRAVATMLAHLHHIESVLDMSAPQGEDEDLEALLGMV